MHRLIFTLLTLPVLTTRGLSLNVGAATGPNRIAIIGAGPGGLTLANALLQSANPPESVTVFERAPELRTTGGGIQINGGAAVLRCDGDRLQRHLPGHASVNY